MNNRTVVVLTWRWGVAIVVVNWAAQKALDLVTPTWVAWVGSFVAGLAFVLLIAITRGFETARGRVLRILSRS